MNFRRPFHWFIIWASILAFVLPWAFFPLAIINARVAFALVSAYYFIPATLTGRNHFQMIEGILYLPKDTIGIIIAAVFYLALSITFGYTSARLCAKWTGKIRR